MADAHEASDHWITAALNEFETALVQYSARITGDAERARDVVQEAFLRLCREDRSRVEGHLAQWLFTVCRRQALDVRRKESRMKTRDPGQGDWNQSVATADPASDLLERQETAGRLEQVLGTLPDNQQEVVRLKFQHGLSYREISHVTSLSVSNVGYLIHMAVKTLKLRLGVDAEARD